MIHRTLTYLLQALTAIILVIGFNSASAMACRDCPFPLRIDENRWLMPDQKLVVQIDEKPFGTDFVLSEVQLKDATTDQVLASGTALRPSTEMSYLVHLKDNSGRTIVGEINWHDIKQRSIQVRFTCEGTCVLGDYF